VKRFVELSGAIMTKTELMREFEEEMIRLHPNADTKKVFGKFFNGTYKISYIEQSFTDFCIGYQAAIASQAQQPVSSDYTVLIGRLAYALKKAKPDSDLPLKATEFLRRKGHTLDPLRNESTAPEGE
jgi:hypothetical protein